MRDSPHIGITANSSRQLGSTTQRRRARIKRPELWRVPRSANITGVHSGGQRLTRAGCGIALTPRLIAACELATRPVT
jgi:DNA-binding transcriptional LysR family regulator